MTMATQFDVTRYQDPLTIQRALLTAKTIAVVGLSKNVLRASHFVVPCPSDGCARSAARCR